MNEKWYAIRTEPNRETVADFSLQSLGLKTYLPMILGKPGRNPHLPRPVRPMIPSYIFGQGDMCPALASAIVNAEAITTILPSPMFPMEIPEWSMEFFQFRCEEISEQATQKPSAIQLSGEVLTVESGAWAGHAGLCVGIDDDGSAILMLPVFRRMQPVPVKIECIDVSYINSLETVVDISNQKKYLPGISKRRSSGR